MITIRVDATTPLPAIVDEVEGRLIKRAPVQARGNRAQAARILGVNRTTLVEKLKRRAQKGLT